MTVLIALAAVLVVLVTVVAAALSVAGRALARRTRANPDTTAPDGATIPGGPGFAGDAREVRVATDDGARLAATVLRPPADRPAGRPVVLAHGWGAARRVWGPVARRLVAAGHTVVLYDQRGHGASMTGSEPIAVDRLGRDLAAVLDQLGLADAVVVGHSGGGFAAMACLAGGHAADRVGGLALLATAAHDQDTSTPEGILMGSRLLSFVASRPHAGLLPLRQTLGEAPGFAALDATREMFAVTPAAVRGACFTSSRGMDLRAALAGVGVPAVVLHGDKDGVIPPRLGRAVADALPAARYEELAGVGHMVPVEAPGRVADVVAELAVLSAAVPEPRAR